MITVKRDSPVFGDFTSNCFINTFDKIMVWVIDSISMNAEKVWTDYVGSKTREQSTKIKTFFNGNLKWYKHCYRKKRLLSDFHVFIFLSLIFYEFDNDITILHNVWTHEFQFARRECSRNNRPCIFPFVILQVG